MPNDLESITKELNQNLRQSIAMASSVSRSASKSPSPESIMISELKSRLSFCLIPIRVLRSIPVSQSCFLRLPFWLPC